MGVSEEQAETGQGADDRLLEAEGWTFHLPPCSGPVCVLGAGRRLHFKQDFRFWAHRVKPVVCGSQAG